MLTVQCCCLRRYSLLFVCPCSRKGSVRVSTYFFKFFARERFVPSHIEVSPQPPLLLHGHG